ncbi:hypothetical protein [Roseomonas elaeocarpi]|uniref:HTH cro/C1-type domain-containing protein n=1 Tax=Roseomonas elaeocarpi TaxID=907779 RepID=A0ABV6JZ35_9PROT
MAPVTLAAVYLRIGKAVEAAGSQRAYADSLGVSSSFVSQVLNGKKPPTDAMLTSIGVKRVVNFVEVAK